MGCDHQTSLTAWTLFHRTKAALRARFLAIFLIAADNGGKSALALSRELGRLRYRMAPSYMHLSFELGKQRGGQQTVGGDGGDEDKRTAPF